MNQPANAERRKLFRQLLGTEKTGVGARAPWRRVAEVSAGDGDVIWSGWAGNGEVFVVGDEGMILCYPGDGGLQQPQWQQLDSGVKLPLHGIWGTAAHSLIAVGWMGAVLHFDGRSWHKVRGAVIDGQGRYAAGRENTPLFAIDGMANGQAWAVGDNGMILHYDGQHWSEENSTTSINLRAVVCAPNGKIYAAGGEGTVLERDSTGTWQQLDCPLGSGFQAMLLIGEDELLLAGGRYFVDKSGFRGELVRYSDGRFQALDFNLDLPRLRALRHYQNGILLVGDQGHLYHLCDWKLVRLESNIVHDLMDIIALPTGEALAVGDFGSIMTAADDFTSALAPPPGTPQASNWQIMDNASQRQLWGIHEAGDGTCYACGEAGTVLRLDGDSWNLLPAPCELSLHCLWDSGSGLYAAGQQGKIYRFDGDSWSLHFDLHLDLTILALWGSAPDCIFAAGDEGLVLHFDGLGWKRMPSGTQSALYGLWGWGPDRLLAAGDFGLVLRYNGREWAEFNVGTENFLYDVWGPSPHDIYAVGLSGTLAHFDGSRWQLLPTRMRDDLLSISGNADASQVYAVGTRGRIMQLQNGQWSAEHSGTDAGLRAVCVSRSGKVYVAGDRGVILQRQ